MRGWCGGLWSRRDFWSDGRRFDGRFVRNRDRSFTLRFFNFSRRRCRLNCGRCAYSYWRWRNRRLRRRGTLCGHRLWRDHARSMCFGSRSFSSWTRGLREHGRLLRRRSDRTRRLLRDRVRRPHRRAWRRRWGRRRCSLLRERFHHVAGLRNLGEIDLRLELIRVRGGVPARRILSPVFQDLLAYEDRFMFLDRAGVRLLLGHSNFRQCVENRLALNFQLSC